MATTSPAKTGKGFSTETDCKYGAANQNKQRPNASQDRNHSRKYCQVTTFHCSCSKCCFAAPIDVQWFVSPVSETTL
jgi:hypothetical protein